MTELKLDKGNDWKAIDIFLFTNGEQSSPPRKHHLDTDSLMMWDGTLRDLGRSHYGSDSTVVLYTINGNKIDDPSQLTHQAAYVAVQPPCTFIQAGYENYLIKATRSLEKTLLRISNSKESTSKGKVDFHLTQSQNYDGSGGASDQNDKKEITKRNVDKNDRSIVRPCIVNVKPPQMRNKTVKCPEPNKVMQKKKTYNSPQSPSNKQALPYKIIPASKRIVIKKRESISRKSSDMKKVDSSTTNGQHSLHSTTTSNYNQKTIPSTTITNFNVTEKKIKNTQSKESDNLTLQTANNNQEDENEKKCVISSIYKNLENEIKSVTAIKFDTTVQSDSKNVDNTVKNCDEGIRGDELTFTGNTENNKKEISFDVTADHSAKNSNIDSSHKCYESGQLDHFVSILNNDKVVKLQLNLEINNCNVSVTTEQVNATNETQSNRTMREDKMTQVNIFELSNDNRSDNFQHGIVVCKEADELVKNIIKEEKQVIIINCTCDCIGLYNLLHSNVECNKIYNEQIPRGLTSTVVEETERCDCEINSINKYQNMTDTQEVFTNLGGVEKTIIITSLHKLSIHNAEPGSDKDEMLSNEKTEQMDSDVPAESLPRILNTNTQTNWCNVMLEARRHPDGRYTFHLPSLQKIKMFT